MKEIRLHGIGGLGTVKAGEMLVHAAVASGKYGNSIPFFGFERQGAPVTSYVRLGDEKIRPKNQVYHPNCTLVLLGRPITNTIMLGAFVRATGWVDKDELEKVICRFFGEKNVETFRRGYNEVKLYTFE